MQAACCRRAACSRLSQRSGSVAGCTSTSGEGCAAESDASADSSPASIFARFAARSALLSAMLSPPRFCPGGRQDRYMSGLWCTNVETAIPQLLRYFSPSQHLGQAARNMQDYMFLFFLLLLLASCDAMMFASTSTAVLAFVLLNTNYAAASASAPAPGKAQTSRCFWDGGRYTFCTREDLNLNNEPSRKVNKTRAKLLLHH
jgi:hypothetical protein